MMTPSTMRRLQPHPLADRLERLRATTGLPHQEWFDLLGMPWLDYQEFKSGRRELSQTALENVAGHFGLPAEDLLAGRVDFLRLAWELEADRVSLPESYSTAAYGRRLTSITSMEFLEKNFGWRLRLDAGRSLGVSEAALRDSFAPISVRFITDLCLYLAKRRFGANEFFEMGAYMYEGNKDSVVGRFFSQMPSLAELYDTFFNESMRLFEQNCSYRIVRRHPLGLTVEVSTNPDVGAEMGVRHIGNAHLCRLKSGMMACIPQYLGLPRAEVRETHCVHRGDAVCRFEIETPLRGANDLKRPFV